MIPKPNVKIVKGPKGLMLKVGDTIALGIIELSVRSEWKGETEFRFKMALPWYDVEGLGPDEAQISPKGEP